MGAGTGQEGCVTVCFESGVGGVVLCYVVTNSGGRFLSSVWVCTGGGEYRLGMLIWSGKWKRREWGFDKRNRYSGHRCHQFLACLGLENYKKGI